jgi:hypothetical protein
MKSSLAFSTYHSLLRIALCVCALVLVFDSGLISNVTADLSSSAQDYVATAVGVKVGVAPNDVNVLTARITELEEELATQEREIKVNAGDGDIISDIDMSTFVLSIILFILLVLIVLNYALDYLRLEATQRKGSTV